ncbi:MAG: S41 family peptidase [Anaerolineales bacterium]
MKKLLSLIVLFALVSLACQTISGATPAPTLPEEPVQAIPSQPDRQAETPTTTPLPLATNPPAAPEVLTRDPDEPYFISGSVEYTSPFFLNSAAEPFIMLEDEAGFVARDHEFLFPLSSQIIGPIEMAKEGKLTYALSLPAVPQGTFVDVDNNGETDQGVQVNAVAYWSNTWGDPFLESRDGKGWSTGYASTITDPDRDYEIVGGKLVIWAPDDQQGFPTGFGADGLLFTEDDPTTAVPAGYTIVDLNSEPFSFTKEPEPVIDLIEGAGALNDFSDLSYEEAFSEMFMKASREYPFTAEKQIDWDALYNQYLPLIRDARTDLEYYNAIRHFSYEIPDGHVNISLNPEAFYYEAAGGYGMTLAELSDGRVIVSSILSGLPADSAGITAGAEITSWNELPVSDALDQVVPFLGPFSTETARRFYQLIFLPRAAEGESVTVEFRNPGESAAKTVDMVAVIDYQSFFDSLPGLNIDELALPIESRILDNSGLAYIRINTFSDDYHLMAQLWDRTIENILALDVPGIILDIRLNSGGNSVLAGDFAGYFFTEEKLLFNRLYYNNETQQFEIVEPPKRLVPAETHYPGIVAVLIGSDCVSACEGFAYTLKFSDQVFTVGHSGTAGAFGEVGRGQYKLPGEVTMQFPTGRSETPDGQLVLEGTGVIPDILVPITFDSVMGTTDTVLAAAETAILDRLDTTNSP